MKKLILISAGILAAVSAASVFLFSVLKKTDYSQSVFAEISSDIRITRDSRGIPSITASSLKDAMFALGRVHAEDRLPLMEELRLSAAGGGCLLYGEEGKLLDRTVSAAGIPSAAADALKDLPPETEGLLAAYTAGINSCRENWKGQIKFFRKENWTSLDIINILFFREWASAFLSSREMVFPVKKNSGIYTEPRLINEIIPGDLLSFYTDETEACVKLLKKINSMLKEKAGMFLQGFAFFIPGTDQEEAFSAFSFNSRYSSFPDWYPVKIQAGDFSIQAVTSAGLPFLFSGSTADLNFFCININADTQDFSIKKIRTEDEKLKYFSAGKWNEFRIQKEPSPWSPEMYSLHTDNDHGRALLSDTAECMKSSVLTMTHLLPESDSITALLNLPLCRNRKEAEKILSGISCLPRYWLLTDNNTADLVTAGIFPVRQNQTDTVKTGSVFFKTKNIFSVREFQSPVLAASGSLKYVQGMQARPVPGQKIIRLETLINESYRNGISSGIIKSVLTDRKIPFGEEFTKLFEINLEQNPITSARLAGLYFSGWDYSADSESTAAALYCSLLSNFMEETFSDKNCFDMDLFMENSGLLTDRFLKMVLKGNSLWFDRPSTSYIERAHDIFDRSFLRMLRELSRQAGPEIDGWKWGIIHRNTWKNPVKKSIISGITRRAIRSYGRGGCTGTVFGGIMNAALEPVTDTCISGFFSGKGTEILLNCPFSMDPLSEFSVSPEVPSFFPVFSGQELYSADIKKYHDR